MRLLSRTARSTGAPLRAPPGRRRRRRLALAGIAAAALVGLGGAGFWLVRGGALAALAGAAAERVAIAAAPLGLVVDNVDVEGRERARPQTILAALGVARGSPILAVDLGAAKARLETLAWVRSAAIERRLPDTLYVRLAERQPLALWQRHGKLVLIDRDGAVVATDHLDTFGALILLVGDDAPAKGAALVDMLATEPALARRAVAAVLVGDRRWNIRLDNGIDVALPEIDAESAWHRLAALERSDELLQRNILAVDLRLPDRLVVRVPPEAKPRPPQKKNRQTGKAT